MATVLDSTGLGAVCLQSAARALLHALYLGLHEVSAVVDARSTLMKQEERKALAPGHSEAIRIHSWAAAWPRAEFAIPSAEPPSALKEAEARGPGWNPPLPLQRLGGAESPNLSGPWRHHLYHGNNSLPGRFWGGKGVLTFCFLSLSLHFVGCVFPIPVSVLQNTNKLDDIMTRRHLVIAKQEWFTFLFL